MPFEIHHRSEKKSFVESGTDSHLVNRQTGRVAQLGDVAPVLGNERDEHLTEISERQEETERRREKEEDDLIGAELADVR